MRETYFTRIWKRAAAEQTNIADGVMRRPERSDRYKGLLSVEQTGDAMDLGGLDRLVERKRRNDCWDAFGQHGFARARRADHQDVVTTGDSHFDRTLYVSLPFHVTEIDVVTLVSRE